MLDDLLFIADVADDLPAEILLPKSDFYERDSNVRTQVPWSRRCTSCSLKSTQLARPPEPQASIP